MVRFKQPNVTKEDVTKEAKCGSYYPYWRHSFWQPASLRPPRTRRIPTTVSGATTARCSLNGCRAAAAARHLPQVPYLPVPCCDAAYVSGSCAGLIGTPVTFGRRTAYQWRPERHLRPPAANLNIGRQGKGRPLPDRHVDSPPRLLKIRCPAAGCRIMMADVIAADTRGLLPCLEIRVPAPGFSALPVAWPAPGGSGGTRTHRSGP